MTETLTNQASSDGAPDWRVLLARLHLLVDAGSEEGALTLVSDAAARYAAHGMPLEVDLRGSHVRFVIGRVPSRGLLPDDLALAAEVGALVRERGLQPDAPQLTEQEIAIDALDIGQVLPFWAAVLGYEPDGDDALVDPLGRGPAVWFQQMDAPRPQRNRIHLDVTVAHDVAEERLAAALAAGGVLVSDRRAPAFWILADREGNEACICTWQARD